MLYTTMDTALLIDGVPYISGWHDTKWDDCKVTPSSQSDAPTAEYVRPSTFDESTGIYQYMKGNPHSRGSTANGSYWN